MKKITQIAVLGSAAVLVAGLGTAYAATSTSAAAPPPLIHACKAKRDGNVRIVGKKTRCKRGETRTTWNQRGVKGDRGPAGPSDAYFAADVPWGTGVSLAAGETKNVAEVRLPAGSFVLNGSAVVQYPSNGWVWCKWSHGPVGGAQAGPNSGPAQTVVHSVASTTAVKLAAGATVYMQCVNGGSGAASVHLPRITAVKAGSLFTSGPQSGSPNRAPQGGHGAVR